LTFLGSKMGEQKLGFSPWDPHGVIRAGILCRIPVSRSKMVGWRPIWWQKGVTWGPLGFWARPAHPAGGRRAGGGRLAVAPTLLGGINLLIKDLDKEMTVAETEEKDAQALGSLLRS